MKGAELHTKFNAVRVNHKLEAEGRGKRRTNLEDRSNLQQEVLNRSVLNNCEYIIFIILDALYGYLLTFVDGLINTSISSLL